MVFLVNSWLPGMLDAVMQASFLSALLLFWLCIYHGLRQNERKLATFYLPKFIVVAPIWLCAIILATWEKCNELKDPTYSHFVDAGNYAVSSRSTELRVFRAIFDRYLRTQDHYRSQPFVVALFAELQNSLLYSWHSVPDVSVAVNIESIQRFAFDAIFR